MTEQQPKDPAQTQSTELEDLNENGVGGTSGGESSFEPEEDEKGTVASE